jgi:hypothetical protein
VEVIHSGDVLMWPGYSNINVQPLMMLLDNKRCGVASACFFIFSFTTCVFLEVLKLILMYVKYCIAGNDWGYMCQDV